MSSSSRAALLCSVVLLACGGDSKSGGTDSASTAATDSQAPDTPIDFADCADWLSAAPFSGTAALCETNTEPALRQLELDAPRGVALSSGREALVWFPDDWAQQADPSVLVVLHGSVGCQEGIFADARWAFGDAHALVSLSYKTGPGSFLDAATIQLDLDEALDSLAGACPTADVPHLMYGVSRGGFRALEVAGLDRAGSARLSAVVSDSGTTPSRALSGLSYAGSRMLLWCGEHDPDPVQSGRTTCEVMENELGPTLASSGAAVDLSVGAEACHGMFGWDCSADCASCDGRTGPEEAGPHAAEVAAWLADAARTD